MANHIEKAASEDYPLDFEIDSVWEVESEGVIESDLEDDLEEESYGHLTYLQRLEKSRKILQEISMEDAIVFHGISLLLSRKLLDGGVFAKYHRAVVSAINRFKRNSSLKLKEEDVARAGELLVKLKKNLINKIEQRRDRVSWNSSTISEELFLMAMDFGLEFVSCSNPEKIQSLYKGILKFRHGVNGNKELDNYAFLFYQRAKEGPGMPCQIRDSSVLKDEDWVDIDDLWDYGDPESEFFGDELETDEDFDPEEYQKLLEQNEEDLIKYIEVFSVGLENLSIEKDIIFHAITLRAMMQTVKPKIYSKHWDCLRDLISTYKDMESSEKDINEVRKQTDKLLEVKHMITKRYPYYNTPVNGVGEFNLISTTTEICFSEVERIDDEGISQMIGDLKLNPLTCDYSSKEIEDLAKTYIEMARNKIIVDPRKTSK